MSAIVPMSEKKLPEDCLVFKHSTTCPISASASQEVKAMKTALPLYWINVREQRDLSTWVAETYGVAHETPQLILIHGGKPQQVWSHYDINRSNVSS